MIIVNLEYETEINREKIINLSKLEGGNSFKQILQGLSENKTESFLYDGNGNIVGTSFTGSDSTGEGLGQIKKFTDQLANTSYRDGMIVSNAISSSSAGMYKPS